MCGVVVYVEDVSGEWKEVFEVGKRQLLFRDPKTSVLNGMEGRNKSKAEKPRC